MTEVWTGRPRAPLCGIACPLGLCRGVTVVVSMVGVVTVLKVVVFTCLNSCSVNGQGNFAMSGFGEQFMLGTGESLLWSKKAT